MIAYQTRDQRAGAIAEAVRGMPACGGRVAVRVWRGGDRVRVYLTVDGRAVGYVAQAPASGAVTIQDSLLLWDHAAILAAAAAAAATVAE